MWFLSRCATGLGIVPFRGARQLHTYTFKQTYARGHFPVAFVRVVTDGYVTAMGIPVRQGRDLSQRDGPKSDPVMLINETMARTLFPGQNAVGQYVRACGNVNRQVVGVV